MTRIFDRRSTLVFVIGVLALVVATSSTAAYAAVARNSVVSRSIKDGAVKARDLGASAVTTDKIADGQVTRSDLAGGPGDRAGSVLPTAGGTLRQPEHS